MEKQTKIAQSNIHAFKYTDEYLEQVKNYNANITNLDPLYTNVQPLHEILVRVYLHEPTVVGGLVMPYKMGVNIPTRSGQDGYAEVESDFPYRNVAVVVSAPDSNPLKPGDVVTLSRRAIQMNVLGTAANAVVRVEQTFVHPDANLQDSPTDITSRHYGYALVSYFEIKSKLNGTENPA